MTQGRELLVGAATIAAFLITALLLGALVLFAVVAFVIGPHGGGILPEWSNLPVLVVCTGGVGYVSFKVAVWMRTALGNRMGGHRGR